MNKELEALKDLREVRGWNDDEFNKRLGIIETALKILDQLQFIIGAEKIEDLPKLALETKNEWYTACYILKESKKKLKVLELIKEKRVDISEIKHSINIALSNKATPVNAKTKEFIKPYICYNTVRPKSEWLTEEEFDLIKEVLL